MDSKNYIAQLKKEIGNRDRDIHQAAVYGKQLFEENVDLKRMNDELNSEKEILKQEKHSLQLQFDTSSKTVASLTSECEFQRIRADELAKKLKNVEKDNEAMDVKIQNLIKENHYYKTAQEDLALENSSLKEKINIQDKEIKNFQDMAEKSLNESDKEDSFELHNQLQTYMLNNKELKDALGEIQLQLEAAKRNENHLREIITELEEAVKDRDSELRTSDAEIKKLKEDMEELQGEVELLKFDQIDTNRRGNSVFAELDDRRNMVESEYKKLLKKFELFQKTYDENKIELDQARGQIAILQSKSSREYQEMYIKKLEESLSSAKQEIQELTCKLSKSSKKLAEHDCQDPSMPQKNDYSYLRIMLLQSQKKEKELENEIINLRMKITSIDEMLEETRRQLYKSKQDLNLAEQEITELNLKVKDLESGLVRNPCAEKEAPRPRIEYLDDQRSSTCKSQLDKTFINVMDQTMVPGEFEFDDDGFHQIKPPRKSNKFVLQEFNRAEKKKGAETVSKPFYAHDSCSDQNQMNARLLNEAKPSRDFSKTERYDNCAQQ